MHSVQLLYGAPVAQQLLGSVSEHIRTLAITPCLGIIMVGEHPASKAYIKKKREAAEAVGMHVELVCFPENTTEETIASHMECWNNDPRITGYITQLPFPDHLPQDLYRKIHPLKDVDGFHPENIGKLFLGDAHTTFLSSATPFGIMEILSYYRIPLAGKHVVIIGKSNIVGKPLAVQLLNEDATVTICHEHTKDIKNITQQADILISATGVAHLIDHTYLKQGVTTIDVGFSKKEGKLYGDINFEDCSPYLTAHAPVPGGLGPVTVACLIHNTLTAYFLQHHAS